MKKLKAFYYNLYITKTYIEAEQLKQKQLCLTFEKEKEYNMVKTILEGIVKDLDINTLRIVYEVITYKV